MSTLYTRIDGPRERTPGTANGNQRNDNEYDDYDDEVLLSNVVRQRAQQFAVRFLKGFGSGIGVFSGVKIVTALMRNPFRERFVSFMPMYTKNHQPIRIQ